jgi:hypothetical protein
MDNLQLIYVVKYTWLFLDVLKMMAGNLSGDKQT